MNYRPQALQRIHFFPALKGSGDISDTLRALQRTCRKLRDKFSDTELYVKHHKIIQSSNVHIAHNLNQRVLWSSLSECIAMILIMVTEVAIVKSLFALKKTDPDSFASLLRALGLTCAFALFVFITYQVAMVVREIHEDPRTLSFFQVLTEYVLPRPLGDLLYQVRPMMKPVAEGGLGEEGISTWMRKMRLKLDDNKIKLKNLVNSSLHDLTRSTLEMPQL